MLRGRPTLELSIAVPEEAPVEYVDALPVAAVLAPGGEEAKCVDAEDASEVAAFARIVVVDVRSREERSGGFIAGSVHMPYMAHFSEDAVIDGGVLERAVAAALAGASGGAGGAGGAGGGGGVLVVFHCMYSKERGPRAAKLARAFLAETFPGESVSVRILSGGFHKWLGLFNGKPSAAALLDGVVLSRWTPTPEGLVWEDDVL
jgi:hypothetical protein